MLVETLTELLKCTDRGVQVFPAPLRVSGFLSFASSRCCVCLVASSQGLTWNVHYLLCLQVQEVPLGSGLLEVPLESVFLTFLANEFLILCSPNLFQSTDIHPSVLETLKWYMSL